MSKFILEFDADSAAFEDGNVEEVVFILHRTEAHLRNGKLDGKVMDSNGNSVGQWKFTIDGVNDKE